MRTTHPSSIDHPAAQPVRLDAAPPPPVSFRALSAAGQGGPLILLCLLLAGASSLGQNQAGSGGTGDRAASAVAPAAEQNALHQLQVGDVVQVKVYQEEDLSATARIGKDGAITLPLLGAVRVISNTVDQASARIRNLLAADYLVNPQVSLNVTEYAKRRFTVLGQVQKPGSFELPPEDSVSLLQAIAMAGGYTRIGNPRKITVQRAVSGKNTALKLDAEAMASQKGEKSFEILPDDVVVVGEKWL